MNIVIVPFHDYKKWQNEGFRTRDAHVCEHFAKDDRIEKLLVVNRPISLAEVVLKRAKWETPNGKIVYKKNNVQLSQMTDKVWCLDIFLMDFFKVIIQKKMWWFTAFNYAVVTNAVNEVINYLNFNDSILLLQNPMAIGTVKNLYCKRLVFDAIDNWLFHPQMPDKELIKNNYDYVDSNADLIMTVSQALTKTFPGNGNAYWVPNGVDVEYFAGALKQQNSGAKVIGYVGKIQDRVDFNLVEECLKKFPNIRFVFLGPVYSQADRIKDLQVRYTNIMFKGDIHYSKLPKEMREFDITIIPHKVDRFTESMNPLKLYEYLAAGKPVVTTGVAGTSLISDYVFVADSSNKFIEYLQNLIEGTLSVESEKIVSSVPEECKWSSRTNTMLELMGKI